MKLLIAIPSLDYMHTEFVKSLTALVCRLKDEGIKFDVTIQSGTLVYVARDKLAKKAINEGYSHVLWLDADMVFRPDLLEVLTESGRPFVVGICHSRREPYASCLFKSFLPVERFEEYPDEPFKVAGSGLACALTEVKILRDVCFTNSGSCFCPTAKLGEDLAFCMRVKDLGYEIWAEPMARIGHMGHIAVYPETHDLYMEAINR